MRFIFSECGSTLHSASGVIRSRGYPEKMEYADCVWKIDSRNKSVLFRFQQFDIPDSHECRYVTDIECRAMTLSSNLFGKTILAEHCAHLYWDCLSARGNKKR